VAFALVVVWWCSVAFTLVARRAVAFTLAVPFTLAMSKRLRYGGAARASSAIYSHAENLTSPTKL